MKGGKVGREGAMAHALGVHIIKVKNFYHAKYLKWSISGTEENKALDLNFQN